eukprot:TRINITY_DN6450_c0_g1_i1.p1 TRINITY_DN6450_c0_g1~~TRINITY_DN6450_c0_g1_i1.p1  ORF type:complete len:134 (+),score=12.72 TRINITY_DN6450_c0_g1_i1:116-517(+)
MLFLLLLSLLVLTLGQGHWNPNNQDFRGFAPNSNHRPSPTPQKLAPDWEAFLKKLAVDPKSSHCAAYICVEFEGNGPSGQAWNGPKCLKFSCANSVIAQVMHQNGQQQFFKPEVKENQRFAYNGGFSGRVSQL